VYTETGSIKLPRLAYIDGLHVSRRGKPTPEQFASKDNIFAIAWNTKQELKRIGMSTETINGYGCGGFNKILKHFVENGKDKYDKTFIDDFVVSSFKNLAGRKRFREQFQLIRKSAAFIIEYYQTGKIETKCLEQWGKQKPGDYFLSVIEKFEHCNNRHKKISPRSNSSAKPNNHLGFL
jgi:hypothetical protein